MAKTDEEALNDIKDFNSSEGAKGLRQNQKIFTRQEIYKKDTDGMLFNKFFRYGAFNPYGAITNVKEYVFFTKPDLHIIHRDETTGAIDNKLNTGLGSGFWREMYDQRMRIIKQLQASANSADDVPINYLLSNTLVSNLEVPSLDGDTIDSASNMYGVNIVYRGSSEHSDDSLSFTLEFKDDRYLNTYYFFRAYEEYETLKHHGIVAPWIKHTINKVLHDQFAVYKFLVDEDMETIIYFGKYYGVIPMGLPRDVFNTENFDNGLTFSINFKAAFFEDMRPEILSDFNSLSNKVFKNNSGKGLMPIYDNKNNRVDGAPAKYARVMIDSSSLRAKQSPNKKIYKLVWYGDGKNEKLQDTECKEDPKTFLNFYDKSLVQ